VPVNLKLFYSLLEICSCRIWRD